MDFNTLPLDDSWRRYLDLLDHVRIAVKQLEKYQGITQFIWTTIQKIINEISAQVRAWTFNERILGRPGALTHPNYRQTHRSHPKDSFPPIEDAPRLPERYAAKNVPADEDAGGPGGPGLPPRRPPGGGGNGPDNTSSRRRRTGYRGDDGTGGGNYSRGSGWHGARSSNPARSSDHMNNGNWRGRSLAGLEAAPVSASISGQVSVCSRCANISSEPICSVCIGGDKTSDTGDRGAASGKTKRKRKAQDDQDASILEPSKRKRLLLNCKASIEMLASLADEIEQSLVEGGLGWTEGAADFYIPDENSKRKGPEFLDQTALDNIADFKTRMERNALREGFLAQGIAV